MVAAKPSASNPAQHQEVNRQRESIDRNERPLKAKANNESSSSGVKILPGPPTPPGRSKKLLKLNGNGGLGTPRRGRYTSISDNGSSSQSSAKRGRKSKSMVVILHYGQSDPSKRQRLGGQIEDIMQGRSSCGPQHAAPDEKPADRALKPLKPTHPFFLGAPTQNAQNDETRSLKLPAQLDGVSEKKAPTQSFATPPMKPHQTRKAQEEAIHASSLPPTAKLHKPGFSRQPDAYLPWRGSARIDTGTERRRLFLNNLMTTGPALHPRRFKNKIERSDHVNDLISNATRTIDRPCHAPNVKTDWKHTRLPSRSVESCRETQAGVLKRLRTNLNHPSLATLVNAIGIEVSAFDRGKCEHSLWVSKYAPKSAAEVLQNGKEMDTLRRWLSSLVTNSIDSGNKQQSDSHNETDVKQPEKLGKGRPRKKRRKVSKDLDDFVVSSEDDQAEMQDFSEHEDLSYVQVSNIQRSVVRTELTHLSNQAGSSRKTNAVLLSGPHGCGKTAAIYAVAHELGFEVFEINPTSRRSGKDILDRVGDMALNHQVRRRTAESSDTLPNDEEKPLEPLPASQGNLNSFFKTKTKTKSSEGLTQTKEDGGLPLQRKSNTKHQKQSLILLEEVDILFEDDRQFWETVLDLATHSKRPIIMTCNNEGPVPLDELSLHAILRLRPPTEDLAADYMLLVAAAEGHNIDRDAALNLYRTKKFDLRASLTELNFWCQMAVGDDKGGLEWFLPKGLMNHGIEDGNHKHRVISNGTYLSKMGCASFNALASESASGDGHSLVDAWHHWGINPESISQRILSQDLGDELQQVVDATPAEKVANLSHLSKCLDHLSDASVVCQVDLPTSELVSWTDRTSTSLPLTCFQIHDRLDTTQTPIPDADLWSGIQDHPLIQSDILRDHEQFDTNLAAWIHLHVAYSRASRGFTHRQELQESFPPRLETVLAELIENQHTDLHSRVSKPESELTNAFDAISGGPFPNEGYSDAAASSFNHPPSTVSTDVAPFIRSIISYDINLENLRQELAITGSASSRSSKRFRTTRASRSAVEGSQRASTRRERWFPKELDYERVRNTAGSEWPESGLETSRRNTWTMDVEGERSSRGSSVHSAA